ncbi:MAG: TlpA family protein disulfide reductase [Anaerolineae bacterium CFX3]|nr:TlpA family protein disulfide reductase [Anaerolineae bacterium CFX3]MCQ3947060.1 TlpA family protein disulfide reductase [Anaerolineae bacterium]MCZ2288486.1 TlpA family protein disulfide reductase [Anaerolineales bacterium]RIK24873.1 MAG: TlpA family protein disulfide reductase [Anaerolineae bacterium]
MQLKRRVWFAGILALGLAWIFVGADRSGTSTNGQIPAPQAGFLAPDFTLETLDGGTVTLSDLRGQAVIVNLWASWCGPCRLEMPAFKKVSQEYAGRGLVILAVNSTSQDTRAAAASFADEYQLPFTIALDLDGRVARLYRISALPTTFFVNRSGVIRKVVLGGPLAETTLRAEIESLLAEATP